MKVKKILMIIFGVIALAINVYIMVEAFTGVEESAKTSMGVSEAIIKFVEDINPSSHIGDDPKKVHDRLLLYYPLPPPLHLQPFPRLLLLPLQVPQPLPLLPLWPLPP